MHRVTWLRFIIWRPSQNAVTSAWVWKANPPHISVSREEKEKVPNTWGQSPALQASGQETSVSWNSSQNIIASVNRNGHQHWELQEYRGYFNIRTEKEEFRLHCPSEKHKYTWLISSSTETSRILKLPEQLPKPELHRGHLPFRNRSI